MVRLAINMLVVRRRMDRLNRITLHTSRLPNNETRTSRLYMMSTTTSCSDNCCELNCIASRMISELLDAYDI